MQTESVTVVISVANTTERNKILNQILTNLTKEPTPTTFKITHSLTKIEIFHIVEPKVQILIKTYLIIIMPVTIDLKILDSFTGVIDFCLDETIDSLQHYISELQSRQGRKVLKDKTHGSTLRQLDKCLC